MDVRSRVRESARIASPQEAARTREDRTIARALGILERRASNAGPSLGDVATCGAFFRLRLGSEHREHFEVAFLDTKHRLLAVARLFSRSVDGAEIPPRIVVQRALALYAVAVLVAHHHPRGNTPPSAADRAVTTLEAGWVGKGWVVSDRYSWGR